MKIDQIAWYAHNDEQVEWIKRKFGLLDKTWIEDEATGHVSVRHNLATPNMATGQSTGLLRFNYDLGIEVEILTYKSGPHWHAYREEFLASVPFLSHIGIHMDKGEVEKDTSDNIVQRMRTFSHTNPYLIEKARTYEYVIRDTRAGLGAYTKYIWRHEP